MRTPQLAAQTFLFLFAWGCGQRGNVGSAHESLASIACTGSTLPAGVLIRSSTRGAAKRLGGSCVLQSAPACLFDFEVTTRSEARISLLSPEFDAALSLYRLDGTHGRHELACNDDAQSSRTDQSRVRAHVEPGRYRVVVGGASGESGEFELFAELAPSVTPAQLCARAPELPEGRYVYGSSRGSGNTFETSCSGGGQGPVDVHRVTLNHAARVRIWQQGDEAGTLSLHENCDPAVSELSCADASDAAPRAVLATQLSPGTYFVVSGGVGRDGMDYALMFERTDIPEDSPPELACERARTLEGNNVSLELDTFHAPSSFAGSCGGDGAPEQLYRLNVPDPSFVRIWLDQPELDAVVYLRRVCANAESEVLCERIERSAHRQEPPFAAVLDAGEYTVVVAGAFPGAMGAAALRVAVTPAGMATASTAP